MEEGREEGSSMGGLTRQGMIGRRKRKSEEVRNDIGKKDDERKRRIWTSRYTF